MISKSTPLVVVPVVDVGSGSGVMRRCDSERETFPWSLGTLVTSTKYGARVSSRCVLRRLVSLPAPSSLCTVSLQSSRQPPLPCVVLCVPGVGLRSVVVPGISQEGRRSRGRRREPGFQQLVGESLVPHLRPLLLQNKWRGSHSTTRTWCTRVDASLGRKWEATLGEQPLLRACAVSVKLTRKFLAPCLVSGGRV